MNLEIEDSFFPHFKALVESFINDNKVKIVNNELPKHIECNSIEEVRRRVYLAEQEEGVTQSNYEQIMDKFFKDEIGIER
jgi:hypothetical protein